MNLLKEYPQHILKLMASENSHTHALKCLSGRMCCQFIFKITTQSAVLMCFLIPTKGGTPLHVYHTTSNIVLVVRNPGIVACEQQRRRPACATAGWSASLLFVCNTARVSDRRAAGSSLTGVTALCP